MLFRRFMRSPRFPNIGRGFAGDGSDCVAFAIAFEGHNIRLKSRTNPGSMSSADNWVRLLVLLELRG